MKTIHFPRSEKLGAPLTESSAHGRAGIALGSNVGDRLANLRSGRASVVALPGAGEGSVLCSPVYETEPIGTGPEAGPFFNAVIEVAFAGPPVALLDALQQIEAAHGRPSKRPRNAPRTLDLDILYVGNFALANDELVIPHPRFHLRRFVLTPLADIRPALIVPGQAADMQTLLRRLTDPAAVQLVAETW